jgi:hypothetical protein
MGQRVGGRTAAESVSVLLCECNGAKRLQRGTCAGQCQTLKMKHGWLHRWSDCARRRINYTKMKSCIESLSGRL